MYQGGINKKDTYEHLEYFIFLIRVDILIVADLQENPEMEKQNP